MPSDTEPQRCQPLAIRLAIGLMALLALSGILMIGNGLYIMAKAELSRVSQYKASPHRLADVRVSDAAGLEQTPET